MCKSVLNTTWKVWGNDSPAISSDLDENQFRSLIYTFLDRKWPCIPVLHRSSFRGISPGSVSLQDGRTYVNLVIAATEENYRDGQMPQTLFLQAVKDLHVLMVNNDFSVCMRKAILYIPCKDCQESTHGEGYFTRIENTTLYISEHLPLIAPSLGRTPDANHKRERET